MIRRLQPGNSSVGVIIDEEELDSISFCSTCAANGVMSKLKERIYLDSKGKRLPDPPDSEDFRMCWQCGLIVPVREIQKSGTIQGVEGVEIMASPFERGIVITGNSSRLCDRMKNLKQRKNKHPDSEIQTLIEAGWELTNYQNYTPE